MDISNEKSNAYIAYAPKATSEKISAVTVRREKERSNEKLREYNQDPRPKPFCYN